MSLTQQANLHTNKWSDVISNATSEAIGEAKTVYAVEVDNRQNSDDVYLKMWDAASPNVGSDDPDVVLKCHAGAIRRQTFGVPGAGVAFGTNVSFACVTGAGTGGTTAPTNAVEVSVWTN